MQINVVVDGGVNDFNADVARVPVVGEWIVDVNGTWFQVVQVVHFGHAQAQVTAQPAAAAPSGLGFDSFMKRSKTAP